MLFHNLNLEAFCHATENSEKVKGAFSALVPLKINPNDFLESNFEGSFGNEIKLIKLEFSNQSVMKDIIHHLQKNISKGPEAFNISDHVTDDRMFWVRFDKQQAFDGKISFGGDDTIQLKGKIAAFPAKRERAIEVISDIWDEKPAK